jgi:hypothetical protein
MIKILEKYDVSFDKKISINQRRTVKMGEKSEI